MAQVSRDQVLNESGRRASICILDHDDRHGDGTGVREGEGGVANAHGAGPVESAAGPEEDRSLAGSSMDLDLAPGDTAADAGTEGLGAGLLGGEAGGETLGGVLLSETEGDFGRGEDAVEEAITEAADAFLDTLDFDEVGAQTQDHAEPPEGCVSDLSSQAKMGLFPRAPPGACAGAPGWDRDVAEGSSDRCSNDGARRYRISLTLAEDGPIRGLASETDMEEIGDVMKSIQLHGYSHLTREDLLSALVETVGASGGCLLGQQSTSTSTVHLQLEIHLLAVAEFYAGVVGTGLELTRYTHQALAGLCTCSQGGFGLGAGGFLSVDLSVCFLQGMSMDTYLLSSSIPA